MKNCFLTKNFRYSTSTSRNAYLYGWKKYNLNNEPRLDWVVNSFYLSFKKLKMYKIYFMSQKAFSASFSLSLWFYAFMLPFHDSIYDIIKNDIKILKLKKNHPKKEAKTSFTVTDLKHISRRFFCCKTTFEMRWYFYVFPMFILLHTKQRNMLKINILPYGWICKINNLWLFLLFFYNSSSLFSSSFLSSIRA